MKKSLSDRDIKKLSNKSRKEQEKRECFESQIELYIKSDDENVVALLIPHWNKNSNKFWNLSYYSIQSDSIREEQGYVDCIQHVENFFSYKDFKRFLKSGIIRKPSTEEIESILQSSNIKNSIGVQSIQKLTSYTEDEVQEIIENSSR